VTGFRLVFARKASAYHSSSHFHCDGISQYDPVRTRPFSISIFVGKCTSVATTTTFFISWSSRNFRKSDRSVVKVFLKLLLVLLVAQLSQPNSLLKQLGIVVGTSAEITFHVAVELGRLYSSQ
jgi:hypothetical protein